MTEHKTWCPAYRHALNSETTVSNAGVAAVGGAYASGPRKGSPKVETRSSQCGCGVSGQYVRLAKAIAKAQRRAEKESA